MLIVLGDLRLEIEYLFFVTKNNKKALQNIC